MEKDSTAPSAVKPTGAAASSGVKLSLGSVRALSKLANKARGNRIQKKKDHASMNIIFRGASWESDHSAKYCPGCDNKFTCINRRHHCRYCGGLRCQACSKWKIEGVRACYPCYVEMKENAVKKSCFERNSKPIHPENTTRRLWDVLVLVLTFHSAIFIPLEMGFPDDYVPSPVQGWIIDGLFVIDVLLNFHTMIVLNNGDLVKDHKIIAKDYLKRWFWFDLMAIAPLEQFIGGGDDSGSLKVWRRFAKLPRLFRIARIVRFMENTELLQRYVRTTRIVRLVILILVSCHWTGCLFYFVCELQDNMTTETYCSDQARALEDFDSRYVQSYYLGLQMLLGQLPENITYLEKITSISLGFLNAVLNAYIIGQVTILIQGTNTLEYAYREKMDILRDTLVTLGLSEDSKAMVTRYYEYLWSRHRQLDTENPFTSGLPMALQTKIKMELHSEALDKCSLFNKCDEALMIALVNSLKVQIFLAGSIVIREKVQGKGMYFLVKGDVSLSTVKKGIFKRLSDGAYFGELSLLFKSPAACTITATSDCDMKVLYRRDFTEIVEDYPRFKKILMEEARRRYPQWAASSRSNTKVGAILAKSEFEKQGKRLMKKLAQSDPEDSNDESKENVLKPKSDTNLEDSFKSYTIERLMSLEKKHAKVMSMLYDIGGHFHIFDQEE